MNFGLDQQKTRVLFFQYMYILIAKLATQMTDQNKHGVFYVVVVVGVKMDFI